MSVSQREKDYWIRRIAELITEKERALVTPGFIEQVNEAAVVRACEAIGITRQIQEYTDLEDEKRRLSIELDEAKQQSRDLWTSIRRRIREHGWAVETFYTIEGLRVDLAKAFDVDVLAETELGRKVLEVRMMRSTIEDRIMLASSPTKLIDAVKAVCTEFNIEADFLN